MCINIYARSKLCSCPFQFFKFTCTAVSEIIIPTIITLLPITFTECIHFFKYCFSFSIRFRRCGSLWSGCWLYRWCHCRVRLFCIRLHICIRYNRFPVNCRAGIVCSAIYLVVYHISFINVKVCHSI